MEENVTPWKVVAMRYPLSYNLIFYPRIFITWPAHCISVILEYRQYPWFHCGRDRLLCNRSSAEAEFTNNSSDKNIMSNCQSLLHHSLHQCVPRHDLLVFIAREDRVFQISWPATVHRIESQISWDCKFLELKKQNTVVVSVVELFSDIRI